MEEWKSGRVGETWPQARGPEASSRGVVLSCARVFRKSKKSKKSKILFSVLLYSTMKSMTFATKSKENLSKTNGFLCFSMTYQEKSKRARIDFIVIYSKI